MSVNYASRLSEYRDKGVCGIPEVMTFLDWNDAVYYVHITRCMIVGKRLRGR